MVFGVNLQTAVYRSLLGADDIQLPTVFRECIDYLEENGEVVLYKEKQWDMLSIRVFLDKFSSFREYF